jgi:hypothetical protein
MVNEPMEIPSNRNTLVQSEVSRETDLNVYAFAARARDDAFRFPLKARSLGVVADPSGYEKR